MEKKESEVKFAKENILKSKKYHKRKDLINVLLLENKLYSYSEVDTLIEKFLKGKVN